MLILPLEIIAFIADSPPTAAALHATCRQLSVATTHIYRVHIDLRANPPIVGVIGSRTSCYLPARWPNNLSYQNSLEHYAITVARKYLVISTNFPLSELVLYKKCFSEIYQFQKTHGARTDAIYTSPRVWPNFVTNSNLILRGEMAKFVPLNPEKCGGRDKKPVLFRENRYY